jgi:FXSXX-COOH protein
VDQQTTTVSDAPDVGDLPLADLLRLADSALGPAVQRLRREADHPEDVLAGFNAAL